MTLKEAFNFAKSLYIAAKTPLPISELTNKICHAINYNSIISCDYWELELVIKNVSIRLHNWYRYYLIIQADGVDITNAFNQEEKKLITEACVKRCIIENDRIQTKEFREHQEKVALVLERLKS